MARPPDPGSSARARGEAVRREVLGDAHVDRALAAATDVDADFQAFITEVAWGNLWAREGLDRRTRSLVTIAILGALGHDEIDIHLRGALRTGATLEEVKQTLLHVAVYAGIPAAHRAIQRAKQIYGGERDDG